ncbi:hypothetical protein AgCh_011584 [Apium graveolens]
MLAAVVRHLRDSDSAVRLACIAAVNSMALQITKPSFSTLSKPLIDAILHEHDSNLQTGEVKVVRDTMNQALEIWKMIIDEEDLWSPQLSIVWLGIMAGLFAYKDYGQFICQIVEQQDTKSRGLTWNVKTELPGGASLVESGFLAGVLFRPSATKMESNIKSISIFQAYALIPKGVRIVCSNTTGKNTKSVQKEVPAGSMPEGNDTCSEIIGSEELNSAMKDMDDDEQQLDNVDSYSDKSADSEQRFSDGSTYLWDALPINELDDNDEQLLDDLDKYSDMDSEQSFSDGSTDSWDALPINEQDVKQSSTI